MTDTLLAFQELTAQNSGFTQLMDQAHIFSACWGVFDFYLQ